MFIVISICKYGFKISNLSILMSFAPSPSCLHVQKQSRSMIVVISMCSVLMIFFFFFFFWEIGFVLYIFYQERKKNYCCYLCYTFSWVSVCVCKGWFGNCKICKSCYVMVSQRKEFWFNCYCFFFFFWMNWCYSNGKARGG